jgi:hypothetical protein
MTTDDTNIIPALLELHVHGHTPFQIEHFVLHRAGECHPWGMFRQALRELRTRAMNFVETLDRLPDGSPDALPLVDRCKWADRLSEFTAFLNHARGLYEKFGHLSKDEWAREEESFWLHRLKVQAAIDLRSSGRVSSGVWGVVPALPDGIRQELFKALTNPSALLDWHETLCLEGGERIPKPAVSYTPEEALAMIQGARHHVSQPQPLDRLERSEGDALASSSLLGDPADQAQDLVGVPAHGSSARAHDR